MGEAAAGGVFNELRVGQIKNVRRIGHPPDRADQLDAGQRQRAPGQQYRERQPPGTAMEQHDQQPADTQVREIAQRVGPVQGETQAHGDE
ncbi:hypothetical protein D3C72_2307110 [compost metagenome]